MRGTDWRDATRRLTDAVTVLMGAGGGAYPNGNSVLVAGVGETVIIDPSLTVAERGGAPLPVDAVLNSHSHEDHMAGNGVFRAARVHVHEDDLPGVRSIEGLMATYGLPMSHPMAAESVERFYYTPRPDATGFADGHVFDLGGVTVQAVHLPGHTRGHSGFRISGGVFFLSDIDLSGFGPYYGDAWSDLDDFEASLARVQDEEADVYVTFHHKGIIESRAEFLWLLDKYTSVIGRRHQEMLAFLAEPRSLSEMASHRFIYRPYVKQSWVEAAERRSAELHVRRMLDRGEAVEVEPGRFCAKTRRR